MKTTTVLLTLLMITSSASFAKSKNPSPDYKIISTKQHKLYFKVDKAFIGGRIEVYDASMNFIEADEIPHTHTIIFFDKAPSGTYLIKVMKGNKVTTFNYTNI